MGRPWSKERMGPGRIGRGDPGGALVVRETPNFWVDRAGTRWWKASELRGIGVLHVLVSLSVAGYTPRVPVANAVGLYYRRELLDRLVAARDLAEIAQYCEDEGRRGVFVSTLALGGSVAALELVEAERLIAVEDSLPGWIEGA